MDSGTKQGGDPFLAERGYCKEKSPSVKTAEKSDDFFDFLSDFFDFFRQWRKCVSYEHGYDVCASQLNCLGMLAREWRVLLLKITEFLVLAPESLAYLTPPCYNRG